MPSVTVNATRMELTRLKNRLKTAVRGHKLLKDKRDELMKQFLESVRENRTLRRRVEEGLMRAHGSFTVASALMSPEGLEHAQYCRHFRYRLFFPPALLRKYVWLPHDSRTCRCCCNRCKSGQP